MNAMTTCRAAPWPSYATLLKIEGARMTYVRRRLRVALANARAKQFRSLLDDVVQRAPWLHEPLRRHPILFRPLLGSYLDIRALPARHLVSSYAHDLEFGASRLHAGTSGFFPHNLRRALWRDPAGRITAELSLNLEYPQEGLWRIALYSPTGVRLYSLCFSVLPGPVLFVGNVQGGRAEAAIDMRELVRDATKICEGLRPQFALLEALRALAVSWKVPRIVGVAQSYHLKAHARSRDAQLIRFSYDQYWLQAGATLRPDGNWSVPLAQVRPVPEHIASRKRAMYRRRVMLINDMTHAISEAFAQSSAPATEPASLAPAAGGTQRARRPRPWRPLTAVWKGGEVG